MQPEGILLALGATVSWAICVFPFTKAGRLMTVAAMNLFRLVVGTVLVAAVAFILDPGSFTSIFSAYYYNAWLWLGISGIVALGIGDYFNYRMYVILSPRYGSVLTTLSPAAALVLGSMMLDEKINSIGIIGILITITGIASMSLGRSEREKIPDHGHGSVVKGIVFGIVAAICTGAGLVFSKKGFITQATAGHLIQPVTGSFIRFLTATCCVLLITFFNGKLGVNWKRVREQSWIGIRPALTGTIFGPVLGVSFALTSIQYINVAVSQTVFALVPVVALLIAHFVYKEKITARAALGAVLAIAGVIILIWQQGVNL